MRLYRRSIYGTESVRATGEEGRSRPEEEVPDWKFFPGLGGGEGVEEDNIKLTFTVR
jgi:hypothetical protein